ncbi:MAG TPA: type II toxin-antitoxin system RelE/ParE family toxin [Planctomycetota bacterium]|nr:type II toxin-antitoxin system RelE/ParE family toxin [Planctomycetota bacterium]
MAGRVLWRRRAEEDLVEVHGHLEADSPAAAERFLDAVERAVLFLLENPRAGWPRAFRSQRARGVRSWPVRGFDASLIFDQPVGRDLEIVRLLHGARDLRDLLEQDG